MRLRLRLLLFLATQLTSSSFRLSTCPPSALNSRHRRVAEKASFVPPTSRIGSVPSSVHAASSFQNSLTRRRHVTQLSSLRRLVDDIDVKCRSSGNAPYPRLVFVGGKGGVGKTSISSALAVDLASDYENDHRVLIVSTDPAHSLGDALDVDLRSGLGKPVMLTDSLTGGRLYGCEVDPASALENFRSNLAAFDVEKLADSLGVSPSLLESLGLREFSGMLNNPPPGLDELVALSNVLDSTGPNSISKDFDVVVVDTAPTGHTLRLLALPAFLDGLLGKLIELRMKLSGVASTLQAIFGSEEAATRAKTIDKALSKLEEFRRKLSGLRSRLKDSERTSFMVVTIPTKLGVAESKRLMKELSSQEVAVTDVVVNQCAVGADGDDSETASDAMSNYYERRKQGQRKWIAELKRSIDEVSSSEEFKANGDTGPIALMEVPFFDTELVGVPALTYLGNTVYANSPSFSYLMDADQSKFIICGGKGGVGKTTTSSAVAVAMANAGRKVAIVSTDPAHSLGDALDMDLSGGSLVDVPLFGASTGSLSAMEIDPSAALSQFKTIVDSLIDTPSDTESSQKLGSTMRDLGEIFDTLPAGTDEVVALAKVVGLIKNGGFDRIILDTAPTGHTLRMLSTPGFIAELIDRILAVAQRINSNPTVKMFLAGASKGKDINSAVELAKSKILEFQLQMFDLEDLFSNASETEFLIVTVPTELATRESMRLLNDLTFEAPDMPIKVRNVVINQVLSDDGSDVKGFLERISGAQVSSIEDLKAGAKAMSPSPVVTEVPYLDTEPRGVFGLKALAAELLKDEEKLPATV